MRFYYRTMVCLLVVVLVPLSCKRVEPPTGVQYIEKYMKVTGYCKCGKCCGWSRNWRGVTVFNSGPNKGKRKRVGITASGTRAKHGTIAADTRIYPYGTVIYVEGYGYGAVEDTGGSVKGSHIDLFFTSHEKALKWGNQQKKVRIWLPLARKLHQ